jgi:hypothetical protein
MSELNELQKMTASKGSIVVNDTDEVTRPFSAVMVLEDTVFATLKIAGTDALADYVTTPATAVKAGAIIVPMDSKKFSGVDLTSGSVIIIL